MQKALEFFAGCLSGRGSAIFDAAPGDMGKSNCGNALALSDGIAGIDFHGVWCERGDSNPYGLLRQILSLVRLPIPPLSRVYRLFDSIILLGGCVAMKKRSRG